MAIIGRPREFDRGRGARGGDAPFWRKGFAATSMNDLCDAMGVRSPSLYAAFGSKEALYLEAVGRYVEIFGPPIWDKLSEGATARAGVENCFARGDRELAGVSRRILEDAWRRWPPSATNGQPELPMSSGKSASICWACCGRGWTAGVANGELPHDDGHRRPEPILSQRLPGDGRPGAGRRRCGGTESRRARGDGRLAERRGQ